MTEDEIRKAKAEGFLVGTEKLAHGVNRRKALEYFVTLLYTATGVGLVGAAIGFAVDEHYDRSALLLCVSQTVWMLMHLREHRREKMVQGATNVALAMTSMFSGFVGAALQQPRPEEETCPICKGSGRIGDDIPCTACEGDGHDHGEGGTS